MIMTACYPFNCLSVCPFINFVYIAPFSHVQVSLKCNDFLLRGAIKNPVLFRSAGQLTLTVDLCLLYTPEICAGIREPF